MFTGIIQNVGKVLRMDSPAIGEGAAKAWIATRYTDLEAGESVAVNGACLTVAEFTANGDALFFLSPETLARTHLGSLVTGSNVNLERAMQAGGRFSGHWVQGHVDAVGKIEKIEKMPSGDIALGCEVPSSCARYCVEKGSIAINGVSLTLNAISKLPGGSALLSLTLIPHTWNHTQFPSLRAGDRVNVEVDILAKYVEQLCQPLIQR